MKKRFSKDIQSQWVAKIQGYFWDERGEEIGDLASDNFLQFFFDEMAPYIYNLGVEDSKMMAEQKMMSLEEDMESLKKSVSVSNRS